MRMLHVYVRVLRKGPQSKHPTNPITVKLKIQYIYMDIYIYLSNIGSEGMGGRLDAPEPKISETVSETLINQGRL